MPMTPSNADVARQASATTGTAGGHKRRVLLFVQSDGYANGVRASEFERFLREQGHQVEVVDTYFLGRASPTRGSLRNKLPPRELRKVGLYAAEAASVLLTRRWPYGRRHISYYFLLADYRLRRSILGSRLRRGDFDVVMCVHPQDAGLLTAETAARTFYDCQTPYADELYYEGKLTEGQRVKLRRLESQLFETVDALSFSWESYARYVVNHYGVSVPNLRQVNWGCTPAAARAQYSPSPRIVYLGSLSSRFIDLPLLSRLTKLYPNIDVYGGPPPDPALELNYLGWAPPTVLEQYQFGLITCTKDDLRREGFSAKHLEYIAYGLPVLVPSWRRHVDLLGGSLPYDEESFTDVIRASSSEHAWRRASDEAYARAKELTWDRTLRPLDDFLREPRAKKITTSNDDAQTEPTIPLRSGG